MKKHTQRKKSNFEFLSSAMRVIFRYVNYVDKRTILVYNYYHACREGDVTLVKSCYVVRICHDSQCQGVESSFHVTIPVHCMYTPSLHDVYTACTLHTLHDVYTNIHDLFFLPCGLDIYLCIDL